MLRTMRPHSLLPRFQCSSESSPTCRRLEASGHCEQSRRQGLARLACWLLLLAFPGLQVVQAQQCTQTQPVWTHVGAGFAQGPGGNGMSGFWASASEAEQDASCIACISDGKGGGFGPSGWVCTPDSASAAKPDGIGAIFAQCVDSHGYGGSVTGKGLCPIYWLDVTTRIPEVCSKDCVHVHDPINPSLGNVFASEADVTFAGASPIVYRRYYNSADASGIDGVPGWRYSYSRSISSITEPNDPAYIGTSTLVSSQYSTPTDACSSGFTEVRSGVPAWAGATASYSGGECVISNGSATIATVLVQYLGVPMPANPTTMEYDLIRDDGQILRYTLQNGVINPPPGISIRLSVSGSGFTVTDDDDNVEVYSPAGVLQSVTNRAGVVQTISYDASGRFSGVSQFWQHPGRHTKFAERHRRYQPGRWRLRVVYLRQRQQTFDGDEPGQHHAIIRVWRFPLRQCTDRRRR